MSRTNIFNHSKHLSNHEPLIFIATAFLPTSFSCSCLLDSVQMGHASRGQSGKKVRWKSRFPCQTNKSFLVINVLSRPTTVATYLCMSLKCQSQSNVSELITRRRHVRNVHGTVVEQREGQRVNIKRHHDPSFLRMHVEALPFGVVSLQISVLSAAIRTPTCTAAHLHPIKPSQLQKSAALGDS